MQPVLFLELNEVNFDYIRAYARRDELPTFARVLKEFGCRETQSESKYENLEPWIQWVTAHTGKTLAEHGVFRLGDIGKLGTLEQIWERLEREKSVRVGAVSPMNATNRLSNPAFFLPDPWTNTPPSGSYLLRRLSQAVSQVVNNNATGRLGMQSALWLLAGTIANAQLDNIAEYARLLGRSIGRSWARAIFLDLLLADVFISQTKKHRPAFATLFLNAAAHIQHHYMFSSPVYEGPLRNPEWYLPKGEDPLLETYRLYDRIVGNVLAKFPQHRVMIATGLHQDPHDHVTYYWRLRDHGGFLRKVGVPFAHVSPRMSRDFLVTCHSESDALVAETRLRALCDENGVPIFEVDNRGSDLFVMLSYPKEITADFVIVAEEGAVHGFLDDVVFVALKNGKHNSIGYFIDSGGYSRESLPAVFPLKTIAKIVFDAIA